MAAAKVIPMKGASAPTSQPTATKAAPSGSVTTSTPNRVQIYGLIDPRDGMIHYVGRTSAALHTRLNAHMSEIRSDGRTRGYGLDKIHWLAELKAAGMAPSIRPLEEVSDDVAIEAERRWVQSLFKAGVPLTNKQWRPPTRLDVPDWLCGYAAALVELHRLSGESAAVRSTIECSGITLDKFKRAGVEDLDLRELAKCVATK